MTRSGKGLRYNKGKLPLNLIDPDAVEELAKVLAHGASKYAPYNWMEGMKWSTVIGSLKRHLNAIEKGEDFDMESGILHAAHLMCNAMFLTKYYTIYPQGDDRQHLYLKMPKIGLDIDEVICDWVGAWSNRFGHPTPNHWYFSYKTKEEFLALSKEEIEEFFMSIPPKIRPEEMPFEPWCYITARSIPVELTMKWIEKNGFPTVKVYSIEHNQSKVDIAKHSGIDIFVDDRFENFVELNANGVCCFLLDAPHNRKYNVGYKRIHSLKELTEIRTNAKE